MLQIGGATDPTQAGAEVIADHFPDAAFGLVPGGSHQTWTNGHPVDGWCVRDRAGVRGGEAVEVPGGGGAPGTDGMPVGGVLPLP